MLLGNSLIFWRKIYKDNNNCSSFVASLGGIFGLCLGGSLISIVELIYYLSVTTYDTVMMSKKNQIKKVTIKPKPAQQPKCNTCKVMSKH